MPYLPFLIRFEFCANNLNALRFEITVNQLNCLNFLFVQKALENHILKGPDLMLVWVVEYVTVFQAHQGNIFYKYVCIKVKFNKP